MLRRKIPSTNSLFTFEAVARLGSFSDASKALNVTQPAVSRSISSLETHLGYPLFERHGRWIKLTDNGDKLFRATSIAFNTISESFREIEQRNYGHETVTVSMSPAAINYWLMPRMAALKHRFPNTRFSFAHYSRDNDLPESEVDLNIRLSNPQDGDVHRWPFADERIIALCTPDYLAQFGTLDKLQPERRHILIEWKKQRYGFDEFFHSTALAPIANHQILSFSDYSNVMYAVLQGEGVALCWVSESSRQIIEGKLVPACAQVVKTGRRYHILASNLYALRPIVEDIRDWLLNEIRQDEKQMAAILKANWNLF